MLLTDIVPNLPSDLKNLFKDHLEEFINSKGQIVYSFQLPCVVVVELVNSMIE